MQAGSAGEGAGGGAALSSADRSSREKQYLCGAGRAADRLQRFGQVHLSEDGGPGGPDGPDPAYGVGRMLQRPHVSDLFLHVPAG